MLVLLFVAWLVIRASGFQTWVVNQLADKLERRYGGQLEIGNLFVRFPNKLIAEDILLKDQLGDTLCFIPKIQAGINKLDRNNLDFDIGRLRINSPYVQILEDPGGGYNFDFLTEMFSSEDSVSAPFFLKCKLVSVRDARLKFKKFGIHNVPNSFTPESVDITEMEISLQNFNYNTDSIAFRLRDLQFTESSGFHLDNMEGNFKLSGNRIVLDELFAETNYSFISIPDAVFVIPERDDEKKLIDKLDLSFSIDKSSIDPIDIQFFYPGVAGIDDKILLSGDYIINRDNWKANNGQLYIGDWIGFQGDIVLNDPSDLTTAFYDVNTDTLWLNVARAEKSYPSIFFDQNTLNLPFDPKILTNVYFQGSMKGQLNNFFAEGSVKTGVGAFRGWLSIRPNKDSHLFDINADFRASLNHFDNFLGLETGIGLISSDGFLEGTWDGDSLYYLKSEMILPFIQWNNYYYNNVVFESIVQPKLYSAAIIVNDENGKLDFSGRVNLRQQEPIFDFDVMVENANLVKLNLYPYDSVASLDLNLHASFSGYEIDDVEGQLWIEDSRFSNSRGEIPINELNLEVKREFNGKKIVLVSDYIDGRMNGDIYLDDLPGQLAAVGGKFFPIKLEPKIYHDDRMNNFSFNINFKNPRPFTEVLTNDFIFKENTQLSGFFRNGGKELEIEGNSPQFLVDGNLFTDLWFRMQAIGSDFQLVAQLDKLQLDQDNVFNQINLNATMLRGALETSINWKGKDTTRYQSEIHPVLSFGPGRKTMPRVIIDLPNATVFYKQKEWELGDSRFEIDNHYFSVDNLLLSSLDEQVTIDGVISDQPIDTLSLRFDKLNLGIVSQFSAIENFNVSGLINGQTKIFNFYDGGLFLADLQIDDLIVNGEKIGLTEVRSQRAETGNDIMLSVLTKRGDISTLKMDGRYSPDSDEVDFVLSLDKLKLNIFDPFLTSLFSEVNGIASGTVSMTGTRRKPVLDGLINVQKGALRVDYLNTRYTFTHPIIVKNNAFLVENLIARDSFGNKATINGGIRHSNFKDFKLDFVFNASDFLFMNTDEFSDNGYWGNAYGTGDASIKGPFDKIVIDVYARTTRGTKISIPISDQGYARESDFIIYTVNDTPDEDPDLISFDIGNKKAGYKANLTNVKLHLDIEVTPEAEALIIFDAQVGHILKGRGSGNLQIDINTLGFFTLNGDYNIDEGEYLFSLESMPIKRFAIEQGSSIKWTGQVEQAQLNIDAVYTTKAALYDLLQDESAELTERVPVTCHLLMKGILESPDISFAINLPPGSDDVARSQLESLTEDELQKQLFSLLIINRFQPLPGLNSGASTRSYGNTGLATTTAVLSSQLNYWLSQISNDFDIGLNYRPGDQITSDEVEVALSTQIFNDRMTINLNGNMDMKSSQGETNQLVGDVEVDYKIKPSGKVRVKAFNRSNDRLIYEYSPYTQGIGLFFREEFNTFGDLYRKYWSRIIGKDNPVKK